MEVKASSISVTKFSFNFNLVSFFTLSFLLKISKEFSWSILDFRVFEMCFYMFFQTCQASRRIIKFSEFKVKVTNFNILI